MHRRHLLLAAGLGPGLAQAAWAAAAPTPANAGIAGTPGTTPWPAARTVPPGSTPPVDTVRFPARQDTADARGDFSIALLGLALQAAGWPQGLSLLQGLNQPRTVAELGAGRLDVAIASAPGPLDAPPGLLVLPVPIRRGLLGLRLLVSTAAKIEGLQAVTRLDELKRQHVLGYGADWRDRAQFERLGFRLATSPTYTGLFAMLAAGRFDYLHRGVNEAKAELDSPVLNPGQRLRVVPGLALQYPLDDYFVLRPGAERLRDAIETGLQRAQADGRYQALFDLHHGQALAWADLRHRRVLNVDGYEAAPSLAAAQRLLLQSLPR